MRRLTLVYFWINNSSNLTPNHGVPCPTARHIFWRVLMTATQLDRLKQDVTELEKYAKILIKKGLKERAGKILEKRDFIDRRIAAA